MLQFFPGKFVIHLTVLARKILQVCVSTFRIEPDSFDFQMTLTFFLEIGMGSQRNWQIKIIRPNT